MKKLLIWGAGDQGLVTLDCALAMGVYQHIDFLAHAQKGWRSITGYRIYQEEEVKLKKFLHGYDEVIVSTGDNHLRKRRIKDLQSWHIPLASLIHPAAIISPFAYIASGCTILAEAVIHTNAIVGTGCIINTGAIVEHDCVIEDYVNISPKAAMAGHTVIKESAFLGIGCTIVDEISVGIAAAVGAGAVVIRNVPDHAIVAGVPAKVIMQS